MNRKAERTATRPRSGPAAQFRAQRPLRGGSLLITVFGDSIARAAVRSPSAV